MAEISAELVLLADHMQRRREAVLQAWRDAVQHNSEVRSADKLAAPQLFDHIPALLARLEQELRSPGYADSVEARLAEQSIALAHGQQRFLQGYDLREVVRELGLLNECVVTELDRYAIEAPSLSHQAIATARRIWATMCGLGTAESVGEYFELQQKEALGHVQELEQALAELQGVERERLDLWQQAAHDLRGNLGVVANATVGLSNRELLEPKRDEFIRILMRNVTSLHHLLEDVAGLARLDSGRERLSLEPIDVSAIMHHLCEGIRPLAQQRRLFLRCEGPAGYGVVGDSVKVRRIAQNLVLNAVKYTVQGGISVSWGDAEADHPSRWTLTIRDTGPGVLGEAAAAAGPEAGSSAASAWLDRGEGIGLSIVKRLCRLLHATIDMDSESSRGTTFRLRFPRQY